MTKDVHKHHAGSFTECDCSVLHLDFRQPAIEQGLPFKLVLVERAGASPYTSIVPPSSACGHWHGVVIQILSRLGLAAPGSKHLNPAGPNNLRQLVVPVSPAGWGRGACPYRIISYQTISQTRHEGQRGWQASKSSMQLLSIWDPPLIASLCGCLGHARLSMRARGLSICLLQRCLYVGLVAG